MNGTPLSRVSAYSIAGAALLFGLGQPLGGCGGRTPNHDVIDRSYSVLINGSLGDFNDAIAADSATHSVTTFPFLAAP